MTPFHLCLCCAYYNRPKAEFVPAWPQARSSHAKRKSHSLFTSSRTRCLGVPLERILFRRKEKASQNRHRVARYPRDESAALKAIAALRRDININDARLRAKPLTLAELVEHYRQRELATENEWKTLSTRTTYEGYLRKWIVPRWGSTTRHVYASCNTGEASGSNRCRQTVLSECKDRLGNRRPS